MKIFKNLSRSKEYKIKRNFKSSIEPEEIFSDAKVDNLNKYEKIELPITRKANFIIFFSILVLFSILLARLFYLQIFESHKFEVLAKRNKTRVYYNLAPRGIIYDRFGKKLVDNIPSFDVVIMPVDLPRDFQKRNLLIKKLSKIIKLDVSEIKKKLNLNKFSIFDPILIKKDIDTKSMLYLESHLAEFPGVRLKKNAKRFYKFSPYLSHIIGYVNKVDKKDLVNNKNLIITDFIGKIGIELSFDKYLRGENGKVEFDVNSKKELTGKKIINKPVEGDSIEITIDAELQKTIYQIISNFLKNNVPNNFGAAVIAVEPKTGEILSTVSFPSFDNNKFSSFLSLKEYNSIIKNPLKPMFNRAIQGEYPPGSTIKPFIAMAALNENVITPNRKIDDTKGAIYIKNKYDPNIVYKYSDWKAHGFVNLYDAIALSCNVYFYTVGGGYGDIKGLGIGRIKKYLSLFNFGSKLGIDIIGEKDGFLPDPQWKKKNKKEKWFLGDTYNVSIGQGGLLVTPIQMAMALSFIANEGKLFKPLLVKKILKNNKVIKVFKPILLRKNFIKNENIKIVKEAMRKTVISGTAKLLNNLPFKAAGKTGTAQYGEKGRTHAWFIGFAPFENPKIALVVLVEGGGEGYAVATPIAKEILQWYWKNRIKSNQL